MSHQITISAKNLGAVALPDFCPRCFWINLKQGFKLPYQIFPGIFSSIDSYNKKLVHSWFDMYREAPKWLSEIKDLVGYEDPPHFSKFKKVIDEYNILLRGEPDGIFIKRDKSYVIADYKTAKYTGNQDKLFPMYETQLNSYTLIAEDYGFKPVSELVLIYMEPITDQETAESANVQEDSGFLMHFKANIHNVELNTNILLPLFKKVRDLYELSYPPYPKEGCKDCKILDEIIKMIKNEAWE